MTQALDQLDLTLPEGGSGYIVEKPISPLSDLRVTATGAQVTASSAPTAATSGVTCADGETAQLWIVIPLDYDSTKDYAALKFYCKWTGATGTAGDLGVTTAQNLWRTGAAVDATAQTAVTVFSLTDSTAVTQVGTVDLGSRSFEPGDVVELTVDVNATTEEIILLGMSFLYKTNLVPTNLTDR